MVVMDIFTRRIIGFGVANLNGPGVCRMSNRAITRQRAPKHFSSDPRFRFCRWRKHCNGLFQTPAAA